MLPCYMVPLLTMRPAEQASHDSRTKGVINGQPSYYYRTPWGHALLHTDRRQTYLLPVGAASVANPLFASRADIAAEAAGLPQASAGGPQPEVPPAAAGQQQPSSFHQPPSLLVREAAEVQRLGLFKFKGCAEPVELVQVGAVSRVEG